MSDENIVDYPAINAALNPKRTMSHRDYFTKRFPKVCLAAFCVTIPAILAYFRHSIFRYDYFVTEHYIAILLFLGFLVLISKYAYWLFVRTISVLSHIFGFVTPFAAGVAVRDGGGFSFSFFAIFAFMWKIVLLCITYPRFTFILIFFGGGLYLFDSPPDVQYGPFLPQPSLTMTGLHYIGIGSEHDNVYSFNLLNLSHRFNRTTPYYIACQGTIDKNGARINGMFVKKVTVQINYDVKQNFVIRPDDNYGDNVYINSCAEARSRSRAKQIEMPGVSKYPVNPDYTMTVRAYPWQNQ